MWIIAGYERLLFIRIRVHDIIIQMNHHFLKEGGKDFD